jgi:hypothetical protein
MPDPEGVVGSTGVWGAARSEGSARNSRDPSARPVSWQGGSYKPKAKASAAQRQFEGAVVPVMAVANKAVGGKGPCGDRVGEAGTSKGMPRRVCDRRELKLLRQWLQAGVMEDGIEACTVSGTPQSGVISPLRSNIYLHYLDVVWTRLCAALSALVRYADAFVVMCDTPQACEEAERRVRIILARLKLQLHTGKTRRVDLTEGHDGFDFLGCHLHKRGSGRLVERGIRRFYLQRWPSVRSMKQVRQRVKAVTSRSRDGMRDVRVSMRDINPVLRGWGNYFRTGNAGRKFLAIDRYVADRLRSFLVKRNGRHLPAGKVFPWTSDFFHGHGLHRLRGTLPYPGVSTMPSPDRSPLCRVRDTRMHGLTGGLDPFRGGSPPRPV